MTRQELGAQVEHWRRRLAPEFEVTICDDWREAASWDDFDPDVHALTNIRWAYNQAEMWFNDYSGRDDREVKVTVVHEMLHLVLRDLRWAATSLPAAAGTVADAMLGEVYNKAEEEAIDRLARLIVAVNGER